MSEDKRKNARTQGRFSDGDKEYSSRRQDKHSPKMPSTDKQKGEKRKALVVGSRVESEIDIQYEEDSKYSFNHLETVKKPQELRFPDPVKELSNTESGISRLIYDPDFLKTTEANEYFDKLEATTKWHDKNIVIRGVEYPQPRLVAWYGPHSYTYAGATLEAREMPKVVLEIKERVEATLRKYEIDVHLNSVLLNLYRNEKDSVAWHSDDELSLGCCPTIASVSLGTTRRFEMRPKESVKELDPKETVYVYLTHGSLIVMDGVMQKDWLHRVPKEFHDRGSRINLTFRTIYPLDQLPPEMPRVSNMKSFSKSTSERVTQQEDPKFDTESFPPLGMEASDKKTKFLPRENGGKDNQQPFAQRKSPKEYRGAGEKKTRPAYKSYQKSVNQRKSQKGETWDDEMLQDVEGTSTTQDKLNKKSDNDTTISSPESHLSQTDFNSNVKESTKFHNKKSPSSDFRKNQRYPDGSEELQRHSHKPTDGHLLKSESPSPSESKPVEIDDETVDLNSNVEQSSQLCKKQLFSSSFINGESESYNSEAHQHNYEPTESTPVEIKEEPIEIDAETPVSGKKYQLNANAPDFVPQKAPKFQNYSLPQLLDFSKHVGDEELANFTDVILNSAYCENSLFLTRDKIELEVYLRLTEDGSLSDEHLKIILERVCSMIRNAYYRQNDLKYSNKYSNRSYGEHSNYKPKQFYGRSSHRY